jgi:hypothetical protein
MSSLSGEVRRPGISRRIQRGAKSPPRRRSNQHRSRIGVFGGTPVFLSVRIFEQKAHTTLEARQVVHGAIRTIQTDSRLAEEDAKPVSRANGLRRWLILNVRHQTMKQVLKVISLVVLGFILGVGVLAGVSFYRTTRSLVLPTERSDSSLSTKELDTKHQLLRLYSQGDVKGLNDILTIQKGEVEVVINGPGEFPVTHTPLVECVIVNKGNRDITILDASVERLTYPSFDHDGTLQDDYLLSWNLTRNAKCHVLGPGHVFSIPVFFRTSDVGQHTIRLAVGAPVFRKLAFDSSELSFPVITQTEYMFEVRQKCQTEPNKSIQPAPLKGG